MIVDTSVIVAILKAEDGWESLVERIEKAPSRRISAASWLEGAIIVDALRDPATSWRFDAIITQLDLEIVPVTPGQARLARKAYQDFGRGTGHAARLNFGDCFAYALAVDTGQPLLFKGDDFRHTGIDEA